MTPCDHAFDYPAHKLKCDTKGEYICPKCAVQCKGCGLTFFKAEADKEFDIEGYCPACQEINKRCGDCRNDCATCEISRAVNAAIEIGTTTEP